MIRTGEKSGMSPNSIRRLRRARDLTMEQLAEAIGTDASTVNKLEKGRMRISDRWLPSLMQALGATADEILSVETEIGSSVQHEVRPASVEIPLPSKMPNDVPVKGTAAGSHIGGAFQLDIDTIVDWVRRPPALAGAKHAYALFVEGISMEPRFQPGDLIFIHPDRPPRVGDAVVVQSQNGPHSPIEAMIGFLRRRTERSVIISKLNPESEIELKTEHIRAIHKVLSTNDLFGI